MSAKSDYVVSKLTRPNGGAATGGFVINLTSSTTPMALSQPKDPTLAQFSFFVSRRLEDGRERFRLHMGYFETMQAAEEMLVVVRDVYPGAWTSEAPGKKLRANKPAEAAAPPAPAKPVAASPSAEVAPPVNVATPPPLPAAPAVSAAAPPPAAPPVSAAAPPPLPAAPLVIAAAPPPPPAAAPVSADAPPPPASPPVQHPFAATPPPAVLKYETEEPFELIDEPEFIPANIPTVQPPPEKAVASPPANVESAKPAAKLAAARAAAKPATKPAPAAAKAAAPKPAASAKPPVAAKPVNAAKPAVAEKPPVVAKPAASKPAEAAKPAPAVVSQPVAAKPAVPATPPVVAPKIAAKVSAPALQATAPAPKAPPPAEPTVQMPAIKQTMSATPSLTNMRQVIEELDDLSDTQTIRLLERHSPYREGSQEASAHEAIRVIKPEDAQSMQAIKNEVKRNAPVLFAVQLDWSVTPFDMAKIPPLAIFNAYSLYATEANRDGRTWYGLRLGFFSDAVSAKQVAYYVRSDFKSVSVVPVTTIEKERANDINAARSGIHRAVNIKEGAAPTPLSMTSSNSSGLFKLLEDDLPEMIAQDVDGETSPRFSKQAQAGAPAAPTPAPAAKAAPAAAPAAPSTPPKASKGRKPGARGARRDAHAHVDEETLDQTLEILGANTLEITNDSAGNTGVRHLRVKVDKKGSKFASLIDRLSGKR